MRILFRFSQKIHYTSWNIDLVGSFKNLSLLNECYINLDYLSGFDISDTHLQYTFIVLFSFEHSSLMSTRYSIFILFMSFLFILDNSFDLLPVSHFDLHLTNDDVRIGWHLEECLDLGLRVIDVSDADLSLQYWIKGFNVVVHTLNWQRKRLLLLLKWKATELTSHTWLDELPIVGILSE